MLKVTLNEFCKSFIDAGRKHNIPIYIINEIMLIFKDFNNQNIFWSSPEAINEKMINTKIKMAEVVLSLSNENDIWLEDMKNVYETLIIC
jgi:hypothetical protein